MRASGRWKDLGGAGQAPRQDWPCVPPDRDWRRSGGHTYPALATVRALRPRLAAVGRELVVIWAGTGGSLEERVARDELIPFRAIATGKLRRAGNPLLMLTPSNARDMARVPVGVVQARAAVREFQPDDGLATRGGG